jgi:hypothetical protein
LLKKEIGGNAKATTAAPKTRERDRERRRRREREREKKSSVSCLYFSRGGSQTGRRARAKEYIFATTRTTKRDRRENIYREIK